MWQYTADTADSLLKVLFLSIISLQSYHSFFPTLTFIQFIDFLSVIVTQTQSLANDGFFISWQYSGNVPILAERKLAVMHHTFIIIWLAKARTQISRVLLEITSMFYE